MGTNYYWQPFVNKCDKCGRHDGQPLHIGKSSAGWCFGLHIHPDQLIYDLCDWEARFADPDSQIVDEYGHQIAADEMLQTIRDRKWDASRAWTSQEYASNWAEPGPNGLVRHMLKSGFCRAHGAGTWDCMVGSDDSW